MSKLEAAFAGIINPYRDWLSGCTDGAVRLKKWEQRLRANPDSAICEATTWDWLRRRGFEIEPAEDVSHGGPDYRCRREQHYFYVEVTCLSRDSVTSQSLISDQQSPISKDPEGWGYLTGAVFHKCQEKCNQLTELDAPCLLAVCTMHGFAATACFDELGAEMMLRGDDLKLSWFGDPSTARMGPVALKTELKGAPFLCSDEQTRFIDLKRTWISGILLSSSSMPDRRVLGVLHPQPLQPFDPGWLPDVPFCRLTDGWQSGQLTVEWVNRFAEDQDSDDVWDAELARREAEIREGSAMGEPADLVMARLRKKLV